MVVVIEFWAFFHPESHYWPPPEFDLICTEYLNALSFGEIEFIKKRPERQTFLRDLFCPLCYVENLLIFCSSWISCPIYVFIGLWSLVSHLPFFHEFIVIKKDTIHSLHIAKIPFYSTSMVCDLKWLYSKKTFEQTNRQTFSIDFSWWYSHFVKEQCDPL